MKLNFTGLFAGAGGLDLGFEEAGLEHGYSSDIDKWSVKTLRANKPNWDTEEADVRELAAVDLPDTEVLLAGFPCQGFSLGGNRQAGDERNYLFRDVVRLTKEKQPKIVVIENVLNLRTMIEPGTGKPFVYLISSEFEKIGYHVRFHVFRVSEHGVPQTRRRFIFIASKDKFPSSFVWPHPEGVTPAREYLGDLVANPEICLPNHDVKWGFKSRVHEATGEKFDPLEIPTPCRFSRTGSDGNPIRGLENPFPAIDTATIWGWAQGNVQAERKLKDRAGGLFVRNPDSKLKLWRISASRLRSFTDREYARLQTFPDNWVFSGDNKRHVHKQIGNAVPVQFALRIGKLIRSLVEAQSTGRPMTPVGGKGLEVQDEIFFD